MTTPNLILIVDDDEQICRSIARTLHTEGFHVDSEYRADHLIEIVREKRPAAVLLDISLPHISGIDACEALKTDPVVHDVPVIIVSAHDSFESVRQATNAGADAYLAKPFKRDHLVSVLRRLVPAADLQGHASAA